MVIAPQLQLRLSAFGRVKTDRARLSAAAAESLPAFRDHTEEIVPQFVGVLEDDYLDVRMSAATSFGLLGEAAAPARPELNQLTQDPNPLIRDIARDAIEHISQP